MNVRELLELFVDEDLAQGDPTGRLLSDRTVIGRIIARQSGVVSGAAHVRTIFGMKSCICQIHVSDGQVVQADQSIMTVSGRAADVMALERTALNLLSRMSGIATTAATMVALLPDGVKLLATRKTAPGLRVFDKEAVQAGGGHPHRFNLGEMIMIKDNHIAAEGSIQSLIRRAAARNETFEVEVDTIPDAIMAARKGAPIILLDNFDAADIRKVVSLLTHENLRDNVRLEASGGITKQNIAKYGATGVDYISVGSMTASPSCLDVSLEI